MTSPNNFPMKQALVWLNYNSPDDILIWLIIVFYKNRYRFVVVIQVSSCFLFKFVFFCSHINDRSHRPPDAALFFSFNALLNDTLTFEFLLLIW